MQALEIQYRPLAELIPYARNARTHSDEQVDQIAASIGEFGFTNPILVGADGDIIAGHGRALAAAKLGLASVPTISLGHLSATQRRAYVIADNKLALNSGWDLEMLRSELVELSALEFEIPLIGFSKLELMELSGPAPGADGGAGQGGGDGKQLGSLAERFGVPPFSVLDARQGYWKERKRFWLSLGIQSEVGRGSNLLKMSPSMLAAQGGGSYDDARKASSLEAIAPNEDALRAMQKGKARAFGPEGTLARGAEMTEATGTSIFDPVLCELAYSWFSPPGGSVLDPFAGGSVRGIVASKLGRIYLGIDLRGEQTAANEEQAAIVCRGQAQAPRWLTGDSSTKSSPRPSTW